MGKSTKKGGMVDGRVGWCHQSTHPSTTLCVACSATMWSIHQSIPTTHTPHTGDGWDGGVVDEGMRGCECMQEREKGVGGQEGKKRRQRMANTSVVVVPHQKPQPRLCLPLVCVWQVWGVCGRRGDQWQPPLWHSGCCGVCVMGLSGGGGSGKACQTNNTPWCVWWWMWRVWWQARRVGGVAWQPHSAHTPTTNHHHGAHHQSLCVCVWHKGRGGGDHNTKAARQAPRLCLRCVCDGA